MKIAAQRSVQEPGRTPNVFNENPFSPLAGTSEEAQGENKEASAHIHQEPHKY
jgi:hypothetical protein